MTRIQRIDHVQLAMPAGAEDVARSFYVDVLGLREVAKPPEPAGHGGAWFEAGKVRVHLGVDADFTAARMADVAFVVDDVASLVDACRARGLEVLRHREASVAGAVAPSGQP